MLNNLLIFFILCFFISLILFFNFKKNIENFNLITRTYPILDDEPFIWYKFEDLNNLNIIGNVQLTNISIRGTNSVFLNNNGINKEKIYIQIPSSIITSKTQLNSINKNSGISISFWFYLTNDTVDYARIFYFGNYSPVKLYNNTFNRIQLSINTKLNSSLSFNIYQNNQIRKLEFSNYVYNNWRHIVWTISNQGIWNIYIDNIKKTNNFNGFIIPPFTSHQTVVYGLGMDMHYYNYGICGYLDDFRIYKKILNDNDVNELFTSSGTDGKIQAEYTRNQEQIRTNNFRNQKKEELLQLRKNLEQKKIIIDNPINQELINEYNSQNININLDAIQNIQEITNIFNSISQSVNNLIIKIDDLINSTRKNALISLNDLEIKLNNYENYIRNISNDDFRNTYNSIKNSITIFKNNVNTYLINKIDNDLLSINIAINNLINTIEIYKRNLIILSLKNSIGKSLANLKSIYNKKIQLNFEPFNIFYNDIDNSITIFIGSLNNSQTNTDIFDIELKKINQNIETLITDINSLIYARTKAINNINLQITNLNEPNFIINKNLINDNLLNISYDNIINKINDFNNSLNSFTTNQINSKIIEIDKDYNSVYNDIALQSTKIKSKELLNQVNIDLNNIRFKVVEINKQSLTTIFNNFLIKIENFNEFINISTSVNDIEIKKNEINIENKELIIEINKLFDSEMKMRQETIQYTLYEFKEKNNTSIENFKIMNRRFEYTQLFINYSGEGNTEIILNDVIFGNHFKKIIGGIEIRYSSRISLDNNPSNLFNGSLAINNKSSFKFQELPRIVINGMEIKGEFISFKYNKKFVLKKYGFRMSENWKKAVGLWEIYYLDENDVYKLLDSNDIRLTKDDYYNTEIEEHYIKFLLNNEETTNEILIIFTGKIESDDKNNIGIYLSQVFLYDGKISNIKSTSKLIDKEIILIN